MKEVKLYLGYAGFCTSKESHSIKGGANNEIKFQALFGLIQHPKHGWILYDTGYTTRFYECTKSYPNKIYANLTKVFVTEEDEIKNQLKQFNLKPSDIKHIIITHFHADHVGGLKDFNEATFYCSLAAFQQYKEISTFWAFSKAILKNLIPENFEERLKIIETFSTPVKDNIFGKKHDLFGDESLFTYDLPGHAAGQIGVELKTVKQQYFLIADACWNKKSYIDLLLPPSIVRLFFDSWQDFKDSLRKVNQFHEKFPKVTIVPTHCSATTATLVSNNYDINAL
jgi:glyoxylase-like metal-dependent hydrolase (beta-lactamase superfamily II)